MGFSRQEYWSGLPFPSPVDPILSDLSTMTHQSWVAPQGMVWFHWVRQGCGPSVIRLTSFLFEYGVSVSALWCPLAIPTILLRFLLRWVWGVSSQLLQQSVDAAPYLGQGVSPHSHPSWPWTWSSSSRPSCTHAATAPCTWGCSSPTMVWSLT